LWSGRPGAALSHLTKAALADPGSAAIWLDLGRAHEANHNLEDAERAYRRALSLEPILSGAHYALALLLRRTRQTEADIEFQTFETLYRQEQQQRMNERSQRTELAKAWLELKQGLVPSALVRFERIPEGPEALVGQAVALSRLGRHREATRVLERARLLVPYDAKIGALLAREVALAGRKP
jgi:Flp pilus assembly protein TadD